MYISELTHFPTHRSVRCCWLLYCVMLYKTSCIIFSDSDQSRMFYVLLFGWCCAFFLFDELHHGCSCNSKRNPPPRDPVWKKREEKAKKKLLRCPAEVVLKRSRTVSTFHFLHCPLTEPWLTAAYLQCREGGGPYLRRVSEPGFVSDAPVERARNRAAEVGGARGIDATALSTPTGSVGSSTRGCKLPK